jgi:hypothetical protein
MMFLYVHFTYEKQFNTLSRDRVGTSIHRNENTHPYFHIVDRHLRSRARGIEMGTNHGRIASGCH